MPALGTGFGAQFAGQAVGIAQGGRDLGFRASGGGTVLEVEGQDGDGASVRISNLQLPGSKLGDHPGIPCTR